MNVGGGANTVSLDRSFETVAISFDLPHGTYSGVENLTGAVSGLGVFYSGEGSDSFTLGALTPNEIIYAGAGDDTLSASSLSSAYYNGGLNGGTGTDKLVLDLGADTSGDTLYAGSDADGGLSGAIYGGGGSLSFGSIEVFDLKTGSGNDFLALGGATTALHVTTGDGDDTVYGGSGADSLDAGGGNNSVDGGAGADTITAGDGDDVVTALDQGAVVNLGGGLNTVSLDRSFETQAISFDLPHGTWSGVVNLTGSVSGLGQFSSGAGNDSFTLGELTPYEVIYAGAGDDTFSATGDSGAYYNSGLYGGTGTDKLIIDLSADTSGDTLYAGSDADGGLTGAIYGGGGGLSFASIEIFDLKTGSGDDHIELSQATTASKIAVGDGNNYVAAGTGNDSLTAGSGNDSLYGGGGTDTIRAGAGDDFVEALGLNSVVDLGTGVNGVSLDRSNATKAISIDIPHGTYSGIVGLTGTLSYVGEFHAGSGNDSILTGANGVNEALYGGAGNDTIGIGLTTSGSGYDYVDGGVGTDTLIVDDSSVSYSISTSVSSDSDPADPFGFYGYLYESGYGYSQQFDRIEKLNITTGSGADSILGSGGADTISTGAGADTLDGGAWIDKLIGGAGNDTYYVDNAKDQIVENAGEGTLDTVYASSATYVLSANIEVLHYSGGDTFIGTGDAQSNAIYADGATAATLHGAAGDDMLYGGAGNDSLYGDGGHDVMYGGGGNDYVRTLTGEGADTINGGGGLDLLTLERTDATVALKVDLTLSGNQSVGEGTVFQQVEQIRFAAGSGNDYARGGNYDDVLKGNGGDDTLIGGGGNDVLEGGDANDLTRTGLADGHDSLTGGTGADTFRFDAPLGGADDTVTDFASGTDHVALSKAGFGIASLADFDIVSASSGAFEHKATLVVDTANHTLSWDADGNGAGAAVLLAHGAFTTAAGDYILF